jgi:3-oxoacyl-[acyl-carrier protein] reductase
MKELAQQVALVTGASRGIGRAIAIELGRAGAHVVGTATTEVGAQRIGEYLAENGVTGRGVELNVTDTAAVNAVVADIAANEGAPSILVNNAGVTRDNLLLRMKEEDWDTVIDTDLKSVYRVTKACLRPMTKARHGRIINIGSVVGAAGNPGQTNYCSAKAGLTGFSKSLAMEVASRGVTVNVVAPGFIDTDMTRGLDDGQREALLINIPVKRLGESQDIAYATRFLASPRASYVTGIVLHVNGGMFMA